MAAYLLKPLGGTKKAEERELDPRYAKALDWALGHRWATAGIGAFLFIFALFLASQTPVGFRPTQDPGFFYIKIQGAPGATRTDMDRAIRQASSIRSEEHTSELQSLMRISYAVFFLKK